jgi:DHA2 family multidrug resistance protein
MTAHPTAPAGAGPADTNRPGLSAETHELGGHPPETVPADRHTPYADAQQWAMLLGVTLLVAVDGINSTATGVAGGDIKGTLHGTPDQFAWVGMLYLIGKLGGFLLGPYLAARRSLRTLLLVQAGVLGASAVGAAFAESLAAMWTMRLAHGIAGGLTLALGQAVVAMALPYGRQPFYQYVLAAGSVIVPTALAPWLQGWLAENAHWSGIWLATLPVTLTGAWLIATRMPATIPHELFDRRPFDWIGAGLMLLLVGPLTYVLVEGDRYNWFYDPKIVGLTITAALAFAAFVLWSSFRPRDWRLVDLSVIRRHPHFQFALLVALMAGFILFGGGAMIQGMIVGPMHYPPDAAGWLIFNTAWPLVVSFAVATWLMQKRGVDPMKMPILGLSIMIAALIWLSTVSTPIPESHVLIGILLRGGAMGLLFLSLTMDWIWGVRRDEMPLASGLFNFNRQLGGMIGTAALGTYMSRHGENVRQTFSRSLDAGRGEYQAYQAKLEQLLLSRGVPPEEAARMAPQMIADTLAHQTAVTTFTSVFLVVVAVILVAGPMVGGLFLFVKHQEKHAH